MAVWKQLYPLSSAMRLWAWHHFLQPQMTPSTLVTASDFLFSMLTADLATVKSYCWKNIEGTQPSQSKSHFQDLSLLRQAGFPCSRGNGTDMLKGRAVRKTPQFRIVLTGVWRETVSSFLGDYLLYLHLSRTLTRDVFYPVAASVSPCRSLQQWRWTEEGNNPAAGLLSGGLLQPNIQETSCVHVSAQTDRKRLHVGGTGACKLGSCLHKLKQ